MLHHLYQLSIEVRVLTEKVKSYFLSTFENVCFFVSGVVWVGLYRKADQIMTAAGQLFYFLLIGIRVFI